MSEAIAFDTHRFVKRLTQMGFTEAQAEALADEQVSLLNSNLSTKQDLAELKGDLERQMAELKGDLERQMAELKGDLERQMAELKGDLERQMAELKGDLEQQMTELKNDLLKWMIGAMIAQTGVIAGVVLGVMRLYAGS